MAGRGRGQGNVARHQALAAAVDRGCRGADHLAARRGMASHIQRAGAGGGAGQRAGARSEHPDRQRSACKGLAVCCRAARRCSPLAGNNPPSLPPPQVVFRHGARTPLTDDEYAGPFEWACDERYPGAPRLDMSDALNPAAAPPPLSDPATPRLRGGCPQGTLTQRGYRMARDLGAELRRRYIHDAALLPQAHAPGSSSLYAFSTNFRRTRATLQVRGRRRFEWSRSQSDGEGWAARLKGAAQGAAAHSARPALSSGRRRCRRGERACNPSADQPNRRARWHPFTPLLPRASSAASTQGPRGSLWTPSWTGARSCTALTRHAPRWRPSRRRCGSAPTPEVRRRGCAIRPLAHGTCFSSVAAGPAARGKLSCG